METKENIFKLSENCEVHGSTYANARVDEVFICINRNTSAGKELINLLETNSGINNNSKTIYSIEYKRTGGWIHVGITNEEIQIGQCIRVIGF